MRISQAMINVCHVLSSQGELIVCVADDCFDWVAALIRVKIV